MQDIITRNKQIVRDYVKAVNNSDREALNQLLHDDYYEPEPIQGVGYKSNPWPKFLKLMGFPDIIVGYMDRKINNKTDMVNEEILWGDILIDRKTISIIAEIDIVSVIRTAILNDPRKLKLNLTSFQRYWIKDFQIISHESVTRFFPTLMELGTVILQRNKQDEIDEYLQWLEQSKIFPVDEFIPPDDSSANQFQKDH